jgi:hypothetical protein
LQNDYKHTVTGYDNNYKIDLATSLISRFACNFLTEIKHLKLYVYIKSKCS